MKRRRTQKASPPKSSLWTGAVAALVATAAVGTVMTAPSHGQADLPTERAILTDASALPPPVKRRTPDRVLVDREVIEIINEIAEGVTYTQWIYGVNKT